jgi:hypothetical protein
MLYGAWLGRTAILGTAAVLAVATPPVVRGNDAVASAYLRNRLLASYVFSVHGTMRMRTFPWLRFRLDGSGIWERGVRYQIHFTRLPFFAKGFQTVDLSALSPAMWRTRYRVTFDGVRGNDDLYVLVDPTDKSLRDAVVRVDPALGIREVRLSYTNGGTIDMRIDCTSQNGYLLPGSATTRIDVPLAKLSVTATFTYSDLVADDRLTSAMR